MDIRGPGLEAGVIETLEAIFIAVVAVSVPVLMLGLIVLIVYVVYREVRGGE